MRKAIVRVGALALLMSMLTGTSGATSTGPFTDVATSHWAYGSIQSMSDKEIMQGLGNGIFKPEGTITRAEFIAVVTRAMVEDRIDATVEGPWYAPNYKAAVDSNLIQSDAMPDTVQSMSTNITRYEMARILVRADENVNENAAVAVDTTAIKDYADIPAEYRYFVEQAYAKGLLTGYSDGMFNGEHNMSRAQAAVVMERLLDAKGEEPVGPGEPGDGGDASQPETPRERPAEMPDPGVYTDEYQEYLDNCGEEIVTKTVQFRMIELGTKHPIPNTTMTVWRYDWEGVDDTIFVMTIRSDSAGVGSFTLDMPKSLYEKTMCGEDGTLLCDQFTVFGSSGLWGNTPLINLIDATVDGANYSALVGDLLHYYLRDDNPLVLDLMFGRLPE